MRAWFVSALFAPGGSPALAGVAAVALVGCAPVPAIDADTDVVVQGPASLQVRPAELLVTTSPDGADPVQFEAWAAWEAGAEPERLDVVAWSLSNRSAGTLDADGVFTASTTNGGEAWVTASVDGVTAQALLHVVFEDAINPHGVDPGLFDAAAGEALPDATWLYPPDEAVVPRNAPALHFMWADQGALAYRVSFRSPSTRVDVYVPGPEYTADEATWARMAATNAGGEVEVTLAAAFPDGVRVAPVRTLRVQRLDAFGAVIYWASSRGGLVEVPYGLPARDFLTQAQTGRCVACHAVSRTGMVAFTYDGGNGPLGMKRLSDRSDVIAPGAARGNFQTFSPDGRYLVTAADGYLQLYDAATGAHLRQLTDDGDATHPDWSPTDDALVFVRAGVHSADWILGGDSRIQILPHRGNGEFGRQHTLVASPDARLYYPAFSPDGAWIAYNRSTGDSYDDPDAEVWVVAADGGGEPIRLDAANAAPGLGNSWPRWGPLPDDDVLWLTFASKRPYGYLTVGNPQIWMTAFDPAAARAGRDPSSPAVWLPNQETSTNNHIPVWVE